MLFKRDVNFARYKVLTLENQFFFNSTWKVSRVTYVRTCVSIVSRAPGTASRLQDAVISVSRQLSPELSPMNQRCIIVSRVSFNGKPRRFYRRPTPLPVHCDSIKRLNGPQIFHRLPFSLSWTLSGPCSAATGDPSTFCIAEMFRVGTAGFELCRIARSKLSKQKF